MNLNIRIGKAGYDSQSNDAENIVDDGGAEDRCADASFELAHFLERLDSDRNRGSCQNNADEDCLEHCLRIAFSAKPEQIESGAAHERQNNTGECNDERGETCFLQLSQIGFQTGGEHQHDATEL